MRGTGYVGRVGSLAVALGVGTVISLWVGYGVSSADTPARPADSPSHADSSPGPAHKDRTQAESPQRQKDEASSALSSPGSRLRAVVHEAISSFDGTDETGEPLGTKTRASTPKAKADDSKSTVGKPITSLLRQPGSGMHVPLRLTPSASVDTAPVDMTASVANTVDSVSRAVDSLVEVSRPLPTVGMTADPQIAAQPRVETAPVPAPQLRVLSTLIDDVLAAGINSGEPQGVAPAMWTIAAAARREFEDAVVAPKSLVTAPAQVQQTAQPTPAQQIFGLAESAVGDVFNTFERVIQGPPQVPPGSTVTVKSSTLQLPCDNRNCTVPADWYFPDDPNPKGIIYFQNGALATGAMYSYTAADLAEQTDSIVVVPTVSDFYQADGYWLGGVAMQQATADLFTGDRDALTASASAAAGYPVNLPQKVVLVGHSEGGELVTGAAADMAAGDSGGDLVGVILLDGATIDLEQFTANVTNIPTTVPVLLIASPPSYWNQLGATADALTSARQGLFTGVELRGGTHGDSVQGGNPVTQFAEYVVAGFPQPQNTAAVGQLSASWVNEMLAGHEIPGTPGQTISITTADGTATAYTLPAPPTTPSPFDVLLVDFTNFFTKLSTGM